MHRPGKFGFGTTGKQLLVFARTIVLICMFHQFIRKFQISYFYGRRGYFSYCFHVTRPSIFRSLSCSTTPFSRVLYCLFGRTTFFEPKECGFFLCFNTSKASGGKKEQSILQKELIHCFRNAAINCPVNTNYSPKVETGSAASASVQASKRFFLKRNRMHCYVSESLQMVPKIRHQVDSRIDIERLL